MVEWVTGRWQEMKPQGIRVSQGGSGGIEELLAAVECGRLWCIFSPPYEPPVSVHPYVPKPLTSPWREQKDWCWWPELL